MGDRDEREREGARDLSSSLDLHPPTRRSRTGRSLLVRSHLSHYRFRSESVSDYRQRLLIDAEADDDDDDDDDRLVPTV